MDGSGGTGSGGTGSGGAGERAVPGDAELLAMLRKAPVLAGPLPDFDPQSAPAAPGPLLAAWFADALAGGVPEPQVMTLSTAGADGEPSARVLILRGLDTADCAADFASDVRARKGRDLTANPRAALTWYWPAQGRQIRLSGPVTVRDEQATRQDFLGRSEAARIGAFTGTVSEPLSGPAEWERAHEAARELLAADPGRVPDTHTVYRLRAQEAEFFQGDPRRFHVRVRYARNDPGWTRSLLWP
ncbi:pyridoxine/pyridoxamine 5'-phosphate oxidase [Actinacidiphila acididurans]|uniref:pyridoxine/pyridoxamine 5'-phosphate oxidase n=1 Tax=Actinacidiphila acididurans TaxID=2784346 RepID=UPI001F304732|nr:pyridoxal 5'-phosphate synthase [Actinacidiphila acididurans]